MHLRRLGVGVTELSWARSTMALSLGFHIIFASISMVLPFFMACAHRHYLKTGSTTHLRLTHAWAKGAAILFATGAVSGTALSFQLGLLWPGFMEHAGPIIGMPFSLEGAAFFLEAIFFGLFIYGWDRLSPRAHFASGVMVGVCGLASGILVVAANGWMNSPTGFVWKDGHATDIQPWAAMFNRAWPLQALHMLVAAVQATSFAAAGLHAFGLLQKHVKRGSIELHRAALRIILPFAVVSALCQPFVGDLSAKAIADRQPEKLAAMEAHYRTESGAGLYLGGWVDEKTETVRLGIKIPYALSFLAHGDPHAKVTGLDQFAPQDRPPVLITHLAFQVMVLLGTLMAGVSALWVFARKFKPAWLDARWFLKLLTGLTPAGFLALEAGWVVTEVGRQPWILYHVIRTKDAVTPVPGQGATFLAMAVLYVVLFIMTFLVLARIFAVEQAKSVTSVAEVHT